MNKRDLVIDLKNYVNAGFITRGQLAKYMGKKDPHDVDKFLYGLERVGKNYFIPDVAESIISMRSFR